MHKAGVMMTDGNADGLTVNDLLGDCLRSVSLQHIFCVSVGGAGDSAGHFCNHSGSVPPSGQWDPEWSLWQAEWKVSGMTNER